MKLVYVPAAIYLFAVTLANGDGTVLWFPTAFALVSFVIVDTIPDLVLRPYVSGRNRHVGRTSRKSRLLRTERKPPDETEDRS